MHYFCLYLSELAEAQELGLFFLIQCLHALLLYELVLIRASLFITLRIIVVCDLDDCIRAAFTCQVWLREL